MFTGQILDIVKNTVLMVKLFIGPKVVKMYQPRTYLVKNVNSQAPKHPKNTYDMSTTLCLTAGTLFI